MAKFQSQYRSLSFYVDGERHEFRDGIYETNDAKVMFALSQLIDVNRVKAQEDEAPAPIHEKLEKAAEAEPTPKPKAPARRKTSTKE